MEPDIVNWIALATPTAAFTSVSDVIESGFESWETSDANPKNRIETLQDPPHCKWRIDGSISDGTHIFAFPKFAIAEQPRGIHVVVHDPRSISRKLRGTLEWDRVLAVGSAGFPRLPVAAHLLRSLEYWSERQHDFESQYRSLPFGSYIALVDLFEDLGKTDLRLVPNYEVEREWLTLPRLKQMWALREDRWPRTLDIATLQFHSQIHECISLVKIPQSPELGCVVFKTVIYHTKYMYHELKMLLSMGPHPNVISNRLFLISKRSSFGGKAGLCGFILPYYPRGTLQQTIVDAESYNILDKLTCARDLVGALLHVKEESPGFHPELRPDNVVMCRSTKIRPVLLDFEQRGTQFAWGPPEIVYISYIIWLAAHLDDPLDRSRYKELLNNHGVPCPSVRPEKYSNPAQGYNVAWLLLSRCQREQAQVFLLGKLLWCLFEGRAGVNNGIAFDKMRRDLNGDPEFPEFRRTPERLRAIIRRCTSGAPEWQGRRVGLVWRNGRLFSKDRDANGCESIDEKKVVFDLIKEWWKVEISLAEEHLNGRIQGKLPENHPHTLLMMTRGTLKQIQSEL